MTRCIIALLLVAGCRDAEPQTTTGGGSTSADPTDTEAEPVPDLGSTPPRADLGVEPPTACAAWCAELAACMGTSETDCLLQCDATHADYDAISAACVGDYEALLQCISGLDCEQIAAYLDAEGDYPCAEQDVATLASCNVVDVPPVCAEFCATSSACTDGSAEQCEVLCGEALATASSVGEGCRSDTEAAFACAAALDCEQLDAWSHAEGDYPCRAEDEQLLQACEPN